MKKYIFILFLIAIIIIVIKCVIDNKKLTTDEDMYKSFLKVIKNAFNNILINVTDVPKINNKVLVRLNHIDDLVDICEKVKKPIYYVEDIENMTCDFILINSDEYCIYTLKVSELVDSLFDKYYEQEQSRAKKDNTKILEDLDKTTIIKIEDGSSFKVSPLRDRDLREIREKEFLRSLKEEFLPKLKEGSESHEYKVKKES